MKSALYSIGVLLLLTSCNNGDSGKSATKDELIEQAAPATDFETRIEANGFTVTKPNLTNEEEKERYAVGCPSKGNPGGADTIDADLKVGQNFQSQIGFGEMFGSEFLETTDVTVTSIQPNLVKFDQNFLQLELPGLPFSSVDQIFSGRPHSQTELTLSQDGSSSQENSINFKFTPAAQEYFTSRNQNESTFSCDFDRNAPNYKQTRTVDKVDYKLNGRNVVAYKSKSVTEGNLICEKQTNKNVEFHKDFGLGRMIYNEIATNDIVSRGLSRCGGTTIYSSDKTVLDSGKVLKSFAEKIISAPLR